MLRPIILLTTLLLPLAQCFAQANIRFTNPTIDSVLRGQYDPADYAASTPIFDPQTIAADLYARISPDSVHAHLEQLTRFQNRNSGSDTISSTKGIGAARRWAESRFASFGLENENRLLSGYLQFDRTMCGATQHRNTVALLPGSDTSAKGFILIEAHMDSRCAGACDTACRAYGADDNGSGSALVVELARVMSKYTFRRSILFMLTIGEEQGLYGAEALAEYCNQQDIPVYAVQNNDIVGGIYCGQTASPPGCPGAGHVDSTNVRLFSSGGYNSPHKQFARFIKLQYQELLWPIVVEPLSLNLMSAEDRTGRGGDHIPFRQNGFTAMRLTSANEHGDGSPDASYTDRQHTSDDSLGLDLDIDGDLDTFFVDFRYLAKNSLLNANAAAMAALGPETPGFMATSVGGGVDIEITGQTQYAQYRVALRTTALDWDTLFTLNALRDTLTGLPTGTPLILSVASVDSSGTESLFSYEAMVSLVGVDAPQSGPKLLGNHPNPFDENTIISVHLPQRIAFESAHILITDASGRTVQEIPITLEAELNEVMFHHGFHASGVYFYSLVVDGVVLETRKMVME